MLTDYKILLAMFKGAGFRAWGQSEPEGGRRLHLDFSAAGACVTFKCNRRGRLESRVYETAYREEKRR